MALASSNLVQVSYSPEATFGTIPAGTVGASAMRYTGESLAFSLQSDTSKEIRSDRQVTDLIQTGASASGGINIEMSYGEYDTFLEAVAMGTWAPLGAASSTFVGSWTAGGFTITAGSATSGNDIFTALHAGQLIKIVAPGNACDGQVVKVHATTPVTSTIITLDPSTPMAAVGSSVATCAIDTLGYTHVGFSGTWTLAGTTITAAVAPTGTDAFTNLVAGQWIRLYAPGNGSNGTLCKVVSATSTIITVDAATPLPVVGTTIVGCKIVGSRLSNGTTVRSYSIQKAFTDVAQFFAYRGMNASKLSLSFASGAVVTGSVDFMGKDSVRSATTQLSSTVLPSRTHDVMNAVTGVGNILEAGVALPGTYIKSLKFDLDNKLRGQTAIGTLGNISVAPGTLEVKGTMEVYLANGTMYDKFLNNTASSISWTMKDGAGNAYAFTLPKVKYSDAQVQAGGLDQDVVLSMPFTALMDATTSKTILIDRV